MPGYSRSQAAEDTRRSIVSDDNPHSIACAREKTPCCLSASRAKRGPDLPSYLRVIPDQVPRRAACARLPPSASAASSRKPRGYPPPAKASHHARTAMGRAVGSPHGWGDGPMTAVLTRARAELRARRASMIALTLLVGIGAATVMTLAAGARRTDTAYPRFARAYKAADVVAYPSFGSEFAILDFNTVARLPQVVATSVQ